MAKVKAGYRITVTSWENDADNYRTISIDGLTEAEVKDYAILCNLLDESYCNNRNRIGNLYDPSEKEIEDMVRIVKESGIEIDENDDDVAWHISDMVSDICGSSENYMTRVVDNWVVEHIPNEVIFEDVTDKFKQ